MSAPPAGVPRLLRRLASVLLRGSDASYILGDLDEAYARDIERGIPVARARRRYLGNALGSAASLARGRMRTPRFGPSLLDLKLSIRMLRKRPAACVPPTLRGLRIRPAEALKEGR